MRRAIDDAAMCVENNRLPSWVIKQTKSIAINNGDDNNSNNNKNNNNNNCDSMNQIIKSIQNESETFNATKSDKVCDKFLNYEQRQVNKLFIKSLREKAMKEWMY